MMTETNLQNSDFNDALERLRAIPATKPNATLKDFDFDDWRFDTFGELPKARRVGRDSQIWSDANPAAALEQAKQLCGEMHLATEPRWLSLIGSSGVGKTHLAKRCRAFYRGKRELCRSNQFVPWVKFVGDLRNGARGWMRDFQEADFLVIDDIGSAHESEYSTAALYELIEARMDKWTILTANLPLSEIAEKNKRVASRMIRGRNVVVDVRATDYGFRKA